MPGKRCAQSTHPRQPRSSIRNTFCRSAAKNCRLQQGHSSAPSENLDKAIKQLNDYVQSVNRDLLFTVDKDSGRTVIKVVDSSTKEVIRQFPSEEVLQVAKELSKGQGLLIRVTA